MCTVTYIPPNKESSFVLTSNRDEKEFRPTLPPEIYTYVNCKLAFPKDEKAGGSWIAINNKGNINCLLNGGIVAHQKQEYHTKSRGTILLEFTQSLRSTHEYFSQIDLGNVEPFTIIAIRQRERKIQDFTEFIWDGNDKYFRQLDINQSFIWSSVTLYNEENRKTRREWFERFYKEHKSNITKEKIFDFHSGNHTNDNSINVIMQREGGLKTVSITQVSANDERLKMNYSDLLNNTVKEIEL
ncbi:MAG: NRDE family protein [Bacteroidales bacterium]|nr:NRDE family protein [Bacteroidales bacterium]